jgi:hypothetical protein
MGDLIGGDWYGRCCVWAVHTTAIIEWMKSHGNVTSHHNAGHCSRMINIKHDLGSDPGDAVTCAKFVPDKCHNRSSKKAPVGSG